MDILNQQHDQDERQPENEGDIRIKRFEEQREIAIMLLFQLAPSSDNQHSWLIRVGALAEALRSPRLITSYDLTPVEFYLDQILTDGKKVLETEPGKQRSGFSELIDRIVPPLHAIYGINKLPDTIFRQHSTYFIPDLTVDVKSVANDPLFWWQPSEWPLIDSIGHIWAQAKRDIAALGLKLRIGLVNTIESDE